MFCVQNFRVSFPKKKKKTWIVNGIRESIAEQNGERDGWGYELLCSCVLIKKCSW